MSNRAFQSAFQNTEQALLLRDFFQQRVHSGKYPPIMAEKSERKQKAPTKTIPQAVALAIDSLRAISALVALIPKIPKIANNNSGMILPIACVKNKSQP